MRFPRFLSICLRPGPGCISEPHRSAQEPESDSYARLAAMRRIPSLDGLRAISIAMVLAGHLAVVNLAPQLFRPYGRVGVRVFFIISGYLITTILMKEQARSGSISLRKFYVRRAYRIFPAAFFYMFVIFAIYWHTLRWYEMGMAVLYLADFFSQPWVTWHLWSLSVEEQFYFLWPSVLKKWGRHRVAILAGVIFFAPVYTAGLIYLKCYEKVGSCTLPGVADNLAVGCLVAVFATRWPKIPRWSAAIFVLLVVAIPHFVADSAPKTLFLLFVLNPVMEAAIAGIIIHVVQRPYWILNVAPVVWFGQISYSLYLWQQPFLNPSSSSPSRYGVIAAVGLACGSYYLIERPLLRYRDGQVPAPVEASMEIAAA